MRAVRTAHGRRRTFAFAASVCAVVACSGGSEREPFGGSSAPAATVPEQSAKPVETRQTEPYAPEIDGGGLPDAPDTCKRSGVNKRCGLVPQCGCTLAETCDIGDFDGNVECIAAGKASMGEPCVVTAGCERGLTCVFGTCHAYCDTPGKACGIAKTGNCVQVNGPSDMPIPNLTVCRVACDLRDTNGCGGSTTAGVGVCVDDGNGATDCTTGGTRTAGQSCTPTDECGPALVCMTSSATPGATCKRWCRIGTTDCGGAAVCLGFDPKVMVGIVEYGVCPS